MISPFEQNNSPPSPQVYMQLEKSSYTRGAAKGNILRILCTNLFQDLSQHNSRLEIIYNILKHFEASKLS